MSFAAPLSDKFKAVSTVQTLASRFTPVVAQAPDTDTSIVKFDYISKMNIERNVELDSGSDARYDVQSDTRFLKNYVEQHISASYPELNVKGHPMVSPPSLAGYDLVLYYAFLLGNDIHHRNGMSYYAKEFYGDSKKKELYNELLNSYVPEHMADILLTLAPVYDPRRSDHLFVPTLAGYSHLHDFGRTIPPLVYFLAHQRLATTSSRKEPAEYQSDIYHSLIVTYDAQTFRTSNYFGTYNSQLVHDNWVNQDFESFLNPVVARSLVQKPSFGKMSLKPHVYAGQEFDSYEFFLVASDENIDTTLTIVRALSRFHQSEGKSLPKLGNILASLSGALLMMHSIEPPTLPTWIGTKSDTALDVKKGIPDSITDKNWATTNHKFLTGPKVYNGTNKWLDDAKGLLSALYSLVDNTVHADQNPLVHITFDPRQHVLPYVLHFQPYDVSPSSLALEMVAGLKIEVAEIDGISIPMESPYDSLDDNNSFTRPAAILLAHIAPHFSTDNAATENIRIWSRKGANKEEQGITASFRTMHANVFPRTGTSNARQITDSSVWHGMNTEPLVADLSQGNNVRAGTNGSPHLGDLSVYLWSSYRIVHKYRKPQASDISMVASFRPVYGLNVTLSRTKNPASIIPH
jgi:hypothetical protein